jgi:hypothetical protein
LGGGDPFQTDLLLEEKFVDDVELAVDMTMLLPRSAVAADMDCRLVVGEDERRSNGEELGHEGVEKASVLGCKQQSHVFGLAGGPRNTRLALR